MDERYRFGPFTLDVATRRLCRDDEELPLPSRAFDTLVHLIRQHGRLVDKDQLIKEVWEGTSTRSIRDTSLQFRGRLSVCRRAFGVERRTPPEQDDQDDRVRRERFLAVTVGLTACAMGVFAARTARASPRAVRFHLTAGGWRSLPASSRLACHVCGSDRSIRRRCLASSGT